MPRIAMIVLGVFLLLAQGPAWADATIESTVKTGGIKGMGASEGILIKRYQGDKMWESASSKFTGAILSRIAGGGENVSIIRLDKGVYWSLDPKNKTYMEKAIEPFARQESKERTEKEQPKVRVTKSEFTVKKTGASETINGFPSEEYLITWFLELEDRESKAKTRSTMSNHLWTTPMTATIRKARQEEQEFNKAYARKLGIGFSPEEGKQLGMETLGAALGMPPEEIEKGLRRVKEEMSKIQGYPIRSAVNWTLEGDPSAAAGKGEGAASGSKEESPKSIGGFLSGLAGKITEKASGEKTSSSGEKSEPFFSSITEVKAIQADSISAKVFEVPDGYVKK